MQNKIIQSIEAPQCKTDIPDFKSGDTLVVQVKVREGSNDNVRERLQAFEGLVIARRNRGLKFFVYFEKDFSWRRCRRVFQSHSQIIESIKVKRHGDVRKAKLYHIRGLSGKAARIKEKIN